MQENNWESIKGKELIAEKAHIRVVFRLLGRSLFLYGIKNEEYQQMYAKFKAKELVKSHEQKGNWIKFDFVDSVSLEELHTSFFDTVVDGYKRSGFIVSVKTL